MGSTFFFYTGEGKKKSVIPNWLKITRTKEEEKLSLLLSSSPLPSP